MFEKLIIPVTPLAQNCTLLWHKQEKIGCFIDPGGDLETLKEAARKHQVHIACILLTHGHLDHAAGAGELAKHYQVRIHGPHVNDRFLFENMTQQCLLYGFSTFRPFMPDIWLQEGDSVTVGPERNGLLFEVYHAPGHTPGHVVYYHREAKIAFVGDVLFKGSIGRSDLPGGNGPQLIASIRQKLWPLGRDVTFIPGHGPVSTFDDERRSNPYVADHITMYKL